VKKEKWGQKEKWSQIGLAPFSRTVRKG